MEASIHSLHLRVYRPARWVARLFLAGALLPWATGVVWMLFGNTLNARGGPVPWAMYFAAGWNYLIASVIPPVALMLVARTRNGPVTWRRLRARDRLLFAECMFATFCMVTAFLCALVWRANHGAIVTVMMTSFLVSLVASLAGVLMGTAVVAAKNTRRSKRTAAPSTSFTRRHPV